MFASAVIAYTLGPAVGFLFALVAGSLCGWTFAMSVVGRGAELEARALVRVGPFADRIARIVAPIAQRVRANVARRRRLYRHDDEEATDLDLDLETDVS